MNDSLRKYSAQAGRRRWAMGYLAGAIDKQIGKMTEFIRLNGGV
jgi:hypothetical protein